MVAPVVAGALISGGASLLGGLLGNRNNAYEQYRFQKEFAQHGIQWRVEDAKRAGLHPLYALGAQTTSYQPVYNSDTLGPALAAAGQDIGRAVMAQATPAERMAARVAMLEAMSRISANDAQAGYYRSLAAREAVNSNIAGAIPVMGNADPASTVERGVSYGDPTAGTATLVQPRITMSRPGESGLTAGPGSPTLREYTLPGGFPVLLPAANDLGEALEPISESWSLAALTYSENVKHFGPEWARKFNERYGLSFLNAMEDVQFKLMKRPFSESRRGRYIDRKKERDRLIEGSYPPLPY